MVAVPGYGAKTGQDSLADDFRQLGSYLSSFFSGREIVHLDLKDLVLEQVFADIYYKDYAGENFTATQRREFNGRINEVAKQFESLRSGGAYILYPKHMYSSERKKVTLVIHRDESEGGRVEIINDYIRKHLDRPIDLDHLEADLQPSHPATTIFPRANKYQYFKPAMSALKWPWLMTPHEEGELILNILLFRRSNLHKLSDLKDTAWPSFVHPSVAIEVLPERLGLFALLVKICEQPIVATVIGILGVWLAYLALS